MPVCGIAALLWVYVLGFVGCLIFRKLNLPLPSLLGSITLVALLAVAGYFPATAPIDALSAVCKVSLGAMMGRRLNRRALGMLSKMIAPALLISVWMVVLSLLVGVLLSHLSGLPLETALLGSTAGGVSEMAIFALSRNYDVATITIIGVTRLIAVLVLTPWLAKKWTDRLSPGEIVLTDAERAYIDAKPVKMTRTNIAFVVVAAFAGGFLFDYLGVPAGLMIGALVGSGLVTLVTGRDYNFPPRLLAASQIGIGIAIAQQFGPEQIIYLTDLRFLVSVVVSNAFSISGTLLLAYVLQKMTKYDPLTALLSTSAGGLGQMVAVAEEMHADSLTIGMLHLARYLAIISCMPVIITLLLG